MLIRILEIIRVIIIKDLKNTLLVKYLNDRKLGKTILMKITYVDKIKRNTEEIKSYFIDQNYSEQKLTMNLFST